MCTRQNLKFSTLINLLVPARSTLARIFRLSAETEGFRATEGGRSPNFLLPLAVNTLKHSLFGLQSLRLGLSLGRDNWDGEIHFVKLMVVNVPQVHMAQYKLDQIIKLVGQSGEINYIHSPATVCFTLHDNHMSSRHQEATTLSLPNKIKP